MVILISLIIIHCGHPPFPHAVEKTKYGLRFKKKRTCLWLAQMCLGSYYG